MINTLKHRALLVTAIFMVATPAFSQAPTDAQRNAIRSECRADYQAHCASIPPGGEASLQCLQKNMSSLSPGCQSAVRAVEPAAAPRRSGAGRSAARPSRCSRCRTGEARSGGAGQRPPRRRRARQRSKPSDAQVTAIRSACRSDYQKVCAGVPTGGAPALQCLEKNKAKVSAPCEKAVSAASGGAAPPAGGATATASPAAAPAAAPAPASGAAADAAARRIVRAEVGLQRRRSHALRRRRARRRPHHAMPGDAGRLDFARLQGSAGPVRSAIDRLRCMRPAGPGRPPAIPRERRGSTGSGGPTARRSRAS